MVQLNFVCICTLHLKLYARFSATWRQQNKLLLSDKADAVLIIFVAILLVIYNTGDTDTDTDTDNNNSKTETVI